MPGPSQSSTRLRSAAFSMTPAQFAAAAPGILGDDAETGTNVYLHSPAFAPPTANTAPDRGMEFFGDDQVQVPTIAIPVPTAYVNKPVSPQALQGDYAREKLSHTRHRMVDVLACVRGVVAFGSRDDLFFEWLDRLNMAQMLRVLTSAAVASGWTLADSQSWAKEVAPAFMKGCTYLNEGQRKSFKAKVQGGLVMFQGEPLDTEAMSTVFSGKGWGIWVMSPPCGKKTRHKFYTNAHVRGEFHHSSFLSGDAIIAGGEWKVKAGKIQYITGKTGHYKTCKDALAMALLELRKEGVDLGSTQVVLWQFGGIGVNSPNAAYPADDFLTNKGGVRTDSNITAFGASRFTAPAAPIAGAQRASGLVPKKPLTNRVRFGAGTSNPTNTEYGKTPL